MRTAVIAGASSGIGEATAVLLAERGWTVICGARRLARLEELARRLGPRCMPVALDVTSPESVDAFARGVATVDALVNCVGHDVGGRTPFAASDIDDAVAVMDANVTGMLRLTRALLPAMLERRQGSIVTVGSVNGVRADAELAAYSASKFAVHGFLAALREECEGTGVRITEVLPGMVRTEFATARWRGDAQRAERYYAGFAALLQPVDVARTIAFALDQPAGVCIGEITVLPA